MPLTQAQVNAVEQEFLAWMKDGSHIRLMTLAHHVSFLIDTIRQKDAENRRMRQLFEQMEWSKKSSWGFPRCPYCWSSKADGHDEECLIGKALADIDASSCPVCNGTGEVMVTTRKDQKPRGEIVHVSVPCAKCSGAHGEEGEQLCSICDGAGFRDIDLNSCIECNGSGYLNGTEGKRSDD